MRRKFEEASNMAKRIFMKLKSRLMSRHRNNPALELIGKCLKIAENKGE